jgi:beta-aspartyl-dipeptidase (metallo-type)
LARSLLDLVREVIAILSIKAIELYDPTYKGKMDILISNGYIEGLSQGKAFNFVKEVKLKNMIAIPGFIDGHVHVIGGGGEGGFLSRIPEIESSKLLNCGITSVIGLLGTDSITKSLISLFAKTNSLRSENINAYMMTGSYQYPVKTITGSIEKDIVLIDPVIGIGELAISDHRSSAITVEEIKKVAQECRVASMISSKSGKIIVHVGNSKKMLSPLIEAVSDDEIKIESFLPTHVNRNMLLLQNALEWIKMGGFVDITAEDTSKESISVVDSIEYLVSNGASLDHILVSSDSNGSIPNFDEKGNFVSMKVSDCSVMFKAFKACVKGGMKIEDALKPFTINVSRFFKLENAGTIEKSKRADMIFVDKDTFEIDSIMAKGNLLNIKSSTIKARGLI